MKTTSPQKKAVLRLALANVAFEHAESLTLHILDGTITVASEIYPGLVAGVVVQYARPFLRADGLGPIPEEFKTLPILAPNIELQTVHDHLIEMRHCLYAHVDYLKIPEMVKNTFGIRPCDELEIQFVNGDFSVITNEIMPPIANFQLVKQLLAIQRSRIHKKLSDHLEGWLGPLPELGHYRITDDGLLEIV
jgi:hypothetical protein